MDLKNFDQVSIEKSEQKHEKDSLWEIGVTGRPVVGQKDVFSRISLLFSDSSLTSKPCNVSDSHSIR